jgi:hypothetical protein
MLQRIQSIYLLLVALLSVVLIFAKLFLIEAPALNPPYDHVSRYLASNSFLMILNGVIGVISFITIFLYKKRMTQVKACNLLMILICVLVGLLFFTADTLNTENAKVVYKYGTYLPLIQLILTFLAMRAIKKDEELVRSADRLR